MYYAPHDAPGGINLAYANSLDGPWIEYSNNPLIAKDWSPHYNVSHVSSPNAIWNSTAGKLYLYFHGENNRSRYATSTDGINFTYGDVIVNASQLDGSSESSYLRVFEYTIPRFGDKYTGLLMSNNNGTRHIYVGSSNDGQNWGNWERLISPSSSQANAGGPFYWARNGQHYVVYHTSDSDIHISEVGANFDHQNYLGVLFDDTEKVAAPYLMFEGDTIYMFHNYGPRLSQKIGLAKAVDGATDTPTPGLETVIVDNADSGLVAVNGSWQTSTGAAGYYGPDYLHDDNADKGSKTVQFTPNLAGGTYDVYAQWASHANRATNAQFIINHANGSASVLKNQQQNGGSWQLLGTYSFSAGTNGSVTVSNSGSDGYVVADAIQFVQQNTATPSPATATPTPLPPTATPTPIGPIWNLIDDDLDDYTANWSTTGSNGSVTQNSGNITIAGSNGYFFLIKNNFSPPTGAFTFETRSKVNTANTLNQFAIRSGNYLITLYLTHGTSGTVQNSATNPTKSYTLDTTGYHTYRVVTHTDYTYDLYVDGGLVWSGSANQGSGSDIFKIGQETNSTANFDIDYVRMGSGELLP